MIVVDANIITYLVIQSDKTPMAERVIEKDSDWRAPLLWRSEMLNVLAFYMRNAAMSAGAAQATFEMARAAVNGELVVEAAKVLELVSLTRCSSYDCEYVAAAQSLRVPLVTADKKLLTAFPDIAVSMEKFTL